MCAKGTGRTYDLAGTTLVNAAEVAACFGVSTSTIHAWYRERRMPGYKMAGGRLILFDMAQVEEWAQKHKVLRRDQVMVDPSNVPSTMEARIARLEDNVAALDVTMREASGVVARETREAMAHLLADERSTAATALEHVSARIVERVNQAITSLAAALTNNDADLARELRALRADVRNLMDLWK